ncbi:hypothetical protein [Breoghania sp.]|uniref:hypothetical protein n=1 Tax=Breoghania sp. TaxID=2065378 RepID=UPI002610A50A|nr:hypothetical protein [Breoghania sp.]MDJ0930444.1 hypothetical protein [Breoghania sp.]
MTGGQLGDFTLVQIFVALVFDNDRNKPLIGTDGDGIRLPTDVAHRLDLMGRNVDNAQIARRIGITFAGIDGSEREVTRDADRNRFAVKRDPPLGKQFRGIARIDETQGFAGTVGEDEGLAVFGSSNNFCGRLGRLIDAFRQRLVDGEGLDPVEEGQFGRRKSTAQRSGQRKSKQWKEASGFGTHGEPQGLLTPFSASPC